MEKLNRQKLSQQGLNKFSLHALKKFVLVGCLATLAACGGGGGDSGGDTTTFPLTVNVSGLGERPVMLQNNDGLEGENLTIGTNGPHQFPKAIAFNGKYLVAVKLQPEGGWCTVENGSGSAVQAAIPIVQVKCSPVGNTHTIGGEVSGLKAGNQIVLQNNGVDNVAIRTNGPYSFNARIANKSGYKVTIATPPVGQECNVSNHTRTDVTGNVSDINIICDNNAETFSIGGQVNGLDAGKEVILTNTVNNNGVFETLPVSANGTPNVGFTFTKSVEMNSEYAVVVAVDPDGQTCSAESNSGTAKQNVTTVVVNCVAKNNSFAISGTLTGLQGTVTLQNMGVNDLTLTADGKFTFPLVANGNDYSVTVKPDAYPFLQDCKVTRGSGKVDGAPVTDVLVTCNTAPTTAVTSFPIPLPPPYNQDPFTTAEYYPVGLMEVNGELYGTTTLRLAGKVDLKDATGYIFKKKLTAAPTFVHMFVGSGDETKPLFNWPAFPTGIMKAKCDHNIKDVYCIFGTTYLGGANYIGATYKLALSNGAVPLFDANAPVEGPVADLIQDEVTGNFYGVEYGNPNVAGKTLGGKIFMRTPAGVVRTLHTFEALDVNGKNISGFLPNGRLILVGDTLYGTAEMGGANGRGTIFKIKPTDPQTFTAIYNFEAATDVNFPAHPRNEGFGGIFGPGPFFDPYASPYSGLIKASDGNLYGVAKYGGINGAGRIFKITATAPHIFTTHYEFAKSNGYPVFELLQLEDGKLYGVTQGDNNLNGSNNRGSIFRIALQAGSPLETLHSFGGVTANGDGNGPTTRLVLGSDGNLYGGTQFGGAVNKGAIYKLGRN